MSNDTASKIENCHYECTNTADFHAVCTVNMSFFLKNRKTVLILDSVHSWISNVPWYVDSWVMRSILLQMNVTKMISHCLKEKCGCTYINSDQSSYRTECIQLLCFVYQSSSNAQKHSKNFHSFHKQPSAIKSLR